MGDDELLSRLASSWRDLMQCCGLPESRAAPFLAQLLAGYGEAHRAYHNLRHVAAVLDVLSQHRARVSQSELLQLAAWYHDAVYDPRAKDNEARSALLAADALCQLGLAAPSIERVGALILMTREHQPVPGDADAQLFLDADLAVLGAAADTYKEYAHAIRQEYAWVSEADYRAGRRAVLRRFLDRPRIFGTDTLFERLDPSARRNLANEIAELL